MILKSGVDAPADAPDDLEEDNPELHEAILRWRATEQGRKEKERLLAQFPSSTARPTGLLEDSPVGVE